MSHYLQDTEKVRATKKRDTPSPLKLAKSFPIAFSLALAISSFISLKTYSRTSNTDCQGVITRLFTLPKAKLTQSFDELKAGKKIRPQYQTVWDTYQNISEARKRKFKNDGTKALDGDNALSPLPRLITQHEYKTLSNAFTQRARAIVAFLKDHYSGRKEYEKAEILSPVVFERIRKRTLEDHADSFMNGQTEFNFLYGPDILRGPNGKFNILEDNHGNVGGVGDLIAAHDALLEAFPEYRSALPQYTHPEQFYKNLIEGFQKQAQKHDGIVVHLTSQYTLVADNETKRLSAILEKLGNIPTVFLSSSEKPDLRFKRRLEVKKDGVYLLENQNGKIKKQKVGYIFIDMDIRDADPKHPLSFPLSMREAAQSLIDDTTLSRSHKNKIKEALKRQYSSSSEMAHAIYDLISQEGYRHLWTNTAGVEGLFDAFFSGKIGLNYTPGTDFISDKEFSIYIDRMIQFYLHEAPVIPLIPARSFAITNNDGTVTLNKELFNRVFSNIQAFVIKPADGRGGDGIGIGPKLSQEEVEKFKTRVTEKPEAYEAQPYRPMSQLEGNIVDIRVLGQVFTDDMVVSKTLWSRGLPAQSGNGKVNLGDKGFEFTVFTEDEN